MSKALLHTQHVSQRETKPLRDGVTIQVDDVVHAKDSLYVRYQVIKYQQDTLSGARPDGRDHSSRPSTCLAPHAHEHPAERQNRHRTRCGHDISCTSSSHRDGG